MPIDFQKAIRARCVTVFMQSEDEWLDNAVAADPHAIFVDSFSKTGEILATHGGEDGGHLINRMVFAQQVSALEAYLGDTLIKAVQAKPETVPLVVSRMPLLNFDRLAVKTISPACRRSPFTRFIGRSLSPFQAKAALRRRTASVAALKFGTSASPANAIPSTNRVYSAS